MSIYVYQLFQPYDCICFSSQNYLFLRIKLIHRNQYQKETHSKTSSQYHQTNSSGIIHKIILNMVLGSMKGKWDNFIF